MIRGIEIKIPIYRKLVDNMLKYVFLIMFGLVSVYPMIWVFINSFKDNNEIFTRPFRLPVKWNFQNYFKAWTTAHMNTYILNSIMVSLATIVLTLIICSMASYILARLDFKFRFSIYMFFLAGMMIPQTSTLLPLFLLYKKIGILNTYTSLVISYTAISISGAIFMLTGFMKTIPKELEESAIIDGCSRIKMFTNIILPMSRSVLITVAILTYIDAWNEFLYALVFISEPAIKTLALGLSTFKSQHFTNYGLTAAGIVISIVPVLIMYILLQEKMIKGMTAGALKG